MPSFNYYIEKRKSSEGAYLNENRPVIISLSYHGKRLKTYTGKKISYLFWDAENQKMKDSHPESAQFNQYLDEVRKEILRIYSVYEMRNEIPDTETLKSRIRPVLKYSIQSFFDIFLEFIELNHKSWTITTYKKVKTLFSQLHEFQDKTGSYFLKPEDIDEQFGKRLIRFYREKNLNDISIRKNLDLLRWFMNWAYKQKKLISDSYREIKFLPLKKTGNEPLYLFWDEVLKLFNVQDLNRKEAWARDIFCFMVFTGLRYSEILHLKKPDVNENIISLQSHRSREIRQNKFSLSILQKYSNKYFRDDSVFPKMSIMTFHKYLRSAASHAGITRPVMVISSGSRSWLRMKDVISSQIAINTYIANSVKLDIPFRLISADGSRVSSKKYLHIQKSIENTATDHLKKFNILYDSL